MHVFFSFRHHPHLLHTDGSTLPTPLEPCHSFRYAGTRTRRNYGIIFSLIFVITPTLYASFISGFSLPAPFYSFPRTSLPTDRSPVPSLHGGTVWSSMMQTRSPLYSFTYTLPIPLRSSGKSWGFVLLFLHLKGVPFSHFYPHAHERFPALAELPYLDSFKALLLTALICTY